MLSLMVHQQQPHHDLSYSLLGVYPPSLSLPKIWPFTCCLPLIQPHRHPSICAAWLVSHSHHLPRIRPEADLVEEACEDVKCPLQPL